MPGCRPGLASVEAPEHGVVGHRIEYLGEFRADCELIDRRPALVPPGMFRKAPARRSPAHASVRASVDAFRGARVHRRRLPCIHCKFEYLGLETLGQSRPALASVEAPDDLVVLDFCIESGG